MVTVFHAYLESWEGNNQAAIHTLKSIDINEESKPTIYLELGNFIKKLEIALLRNPI